MINLPQTELLVNSIAKQNYESNNYDSVKSGWKNISFIPEKFSHQDIKVNMRKDFNHQSNSCYKWYRNLIIPKINIQLKSNTESITTGTGYEENFEDIYAIFSCYKYHENASYNVQQVPMKGQVIQPFSLNQRQKSKKKFNQLKLLQTNSKNLQFTQSHIQNRKIYYCLCITVCKMENRQVAQELMTSLLMPILVENRKKSLQNRTNKYMKFIEFLPIEFQRPLFLPIQESKDDAVFKYCIENHMKNEALRIEQSQNDDFSKSSSLNESVPIESPFNNFGAFYLKEVRNSSGDELPNQSSDDERKSVPKQKYNRSPKDAESMEEENSEFVLQDDLISALIYLSSKTIRHKIYHPFFLSSRFGSAFDLKFRRDLIQSEELQKQSLVDMQEIFLNSVFFPKKTHKDLDDLSFKNQPICLLIKPTFREQCVDSIFFHKISAQIANYLECIQTNEGLFVGFEEQIPNIKDYESVNFEQSDYKNCYDRLSRIPIFLQQNSGLTSQKGSCSHYEIKINPTFKEGMKNFEEEGIDIYRTIVNCGVKDDSERRKLKKIPLSAVFTVSETDSNQKQNQETDLIQSKTTKKTQSNIQTLASPSHGEIDNANFNQNLQQINQNKTQSSKNQLIIQQSTNQKSTPILTAQKSITVSPQTFKIIESASPAEIEDHQLTELQQQQPEPIVEEEIENNNNNNNNQPHSSPVLAEKSKADSQSTLKQAPININSGISEEIKNISEDKAQQQQQQQSPSQNSNENNTSNNLINNNNSMNNNSNINQMPNSCFINYPQMPMGFSYYPQQPYQFTPNMNMNYPNSYMQNSMFQFPQMQMNYGQQMYQLQQFQNNNTSNNSSGNQQLTQQQQQNPNSQPIGYLTIPVYQNSPQQQQQPQQNQQSCN